MIAASMLPFLWNVFVSLRNGKLAGDDPWEGNTLEWATIVAAAALQLRPPAGDPLRAARLRRPARPDGRRTEGAADDDRRRHALTTTPTHSPVDGLAHDAPGGISNADPRDAPVHHLRGDVLRRACSPPTSASGPSTGDRGRRLQPTGRRSEFAHLLNPFAADPSLPADDHPDPSLGHLPAGDLGDPQGRPARLHPQHRRSRSSSGVVVPDHAGHRLQRS